MIYTKEEQAKDNNEFIEKLTNHKGALVAALEKIEKEIADIIGDFDENAVNENGFAVKHPQDATIRKMRFEAAQIKSRIQSVEKQIKEIEA